MTQTIEAFAPTLCDILGIERPGLCTAKPLGEIVAAAREALGGRKPQRVLLFAPDAIGSHLESLIPEHFAKLREIAPFEAELRSVLPAKTPVCFASIFSGAAPEKHGIRSYERPVLTCDTLFDALLRAGKRVAIVAVRDCSIDLIFRKRNLSYYSEDYDPQVTARTLSLLELDKYDLILAYHQEYDDLMHRNTPDSPVALQAAKNNIAAFAELSSALDKHWRSYDRLIAFIPDHGAYTDPENGRGSHGKDIPDGVELRHFYDFRPARFNP